MEELRFFDWAAIQEMFHSRTEEGAAITSIPRPGFGETTLWQDWQVCAQGCWMRYDAKGRSL
jgi:hypothetical protein